MLPQPGSHYQTARPAKSSTYLLLPGQHVDFQLHHEVRIPKQRSLLKTHFNL